MLPRAKASAGEADPAVVRENWLASLASRNRGNNFRIRKVRAAAQARPPTARRTNGGAARDGSG